MTYQCTKEERAFLDQYDASRYERPSVTTDIAVFTLDDLDRLSLLLIRRGQFPYKDRWALPGGFLHTGKESIDECAQRELMEETGIKDAFFSQLYTFGAPDRDPRTTVISVAYMALIPKHKLKVKAGDDAKEADIFQIKYDVDGMQFSNGDITIRESDLAFDHADVIRMAITRLRNRIDYEDDAFNLLKDPAEFTISELKRIHETIKNKTLDLPNFRKSFLRDYVKTEKVKELDKTIVSKGKPAKLYKWMGGDVL
ncbi:MAG: NUDIX hydrolase [Lachnospiraceae bacterium]|nr:NUDIX hydrolase [Lachnospiraceae bacterium]